MGMTVATEISPKKRAGAANRRLLTRRRRGTAIYTDVEEGKNLSMTRRPQGGGTKKGPGPQVCAGAQRSCPRGESQTDLENRVQGILSEARRFDRKKEN